jgi:ethanolamine permease
MSTFNALIQPIRHHKIVLLMAWYIASSLLPVTLPEQFTMPLTDTVSVLISPALQIVLFVSIVAVAVAHANGMLKRWWQQYRIADRKTLRLSIYTLAIGLSLAAGGVLEQVLTFSVLPGLLVYSILSIHILKLIRQWQLADKQGLYRLLQPVPVLMLLGLGVVFYFMVFLGCGASLLSMVAFWLYIQHASF